MKYHKLVRDNKIKTMNEAETRAEYIDPKLKASGWGEVDGSKILREFHITDGQIRGGGGRGKKEIADFPTPDDLWNKTFSNYNQWKQTFDSVGFSDGGSGKRPRYYQENAINNTLNAIAEEKTRVLLTLATGTGKTFIASQIAWKLFQSRYTLKRDGARQPRILFLADRNILADQAMKEVLFHEDLHETMSKRGLERSKELNWQKAAQDIARHFRGL